MAIDDAPREVRRLPEKEVLRQWLALYVAGKHAGQKPPAISPYLGRDATWVEVDVPHAFYDADWNTEGAALSAAQIARASKYASLSGRLPPGMAGFKGRRGNKKMFVTDGNHRAYAAYLRGEPSARFYVPANEWDHFRRSTGLA